jgi:hypothetical protein
MPPHLWIAGFHDFSKVWVCILEYIVKTVVGNTQPSLAKCTEEVSIHSTPPMHCRDPQNTSAHMRELNPCYTSGSTLSQVILAMCLCAGRDSLDYLLCSQYFLEKSSTKKSQCKGLNSKIRQLQASNPHQQNTEDDTC